MASDLDRTQAFYVLGWTYTESQPEYGGYLNALVDGRTVAGLSPTMEGMEDAPHVWSVYLATDDIAADAAKAADAGAAALFEPMEVGPFGFMGMWNDPTGAAFGMCSVSASWSSAGASSDRSCPSALASSSSSGAGVQSST